MRNEHRHSMRLIGALLVSLTIFEPLSIAAPPIMDDEFVLWPSLGFFPGFPPDAEEASRPFTVYGFADVSYDDNLFRLSDHPAVTVFGAEDRADIVTRLGLGARAELKLGRQQFEFDAHADRLLFDTFSQLNTWVYSGDANWLWAIGNRLNGELGFARSRRLPDFAEVGFAGGKVTEQLAHGSASLRILRRIDLRALAEQSEFDYDDTLRTDLDNRVRSGTGGVFYVSPADWSLGVQHRVSDGDYPNFQTIPPVGAGPAPRLVDNRYREKDSSVAFSMGFDNPGGLQARVGHTERKHDQLSQRDFSGGTGRFDLRFAPTAKVVLDLSAYRELRAIEELSAGYAFVRGGRAGPAWAPTPKTVLQVSYVHELREFQGEPTTLLINQAPREDRTRAARFAAGFRPTDYFQVGLAYERGIRDSNILFEDYEYNLVQLHLVGAL